VRAVCFIRMIKGAVGRSTCVFRASKPGGRGPLRTPSAVQPPPPRETDRLRRCRCLHPGDESDLLTYCVSRDALTKTTSDARHVTGMSRLLDLIRCVFDPF